MINIFEYQTYMESIVRKIVSLFPGAQLSAEDLRQRGWLELIEAAGRYDAEKGAKFTTFAYRAVEEGIKREAIFQINQSGVTQAELLEAMWETGDAAPDIPTVLSGVIDEILRQINPVEYAEENDARYRIKYRGYRENLLDVKEEIRELKRETRRKDADMMASILNMYKIKISIISV